MEPELLSTLILKVISQQMMKNNVLFIMAICLCSVLLSCIDRNYNDLGKPYAWMDHRIIVKFKGEMNNSDFDILIPTQVLNYDYDDKYIIAYQIYDGDSFFYDSLFVYNRDSFLRQYKKIKQLKYCYWIIDKETGKIWGPMRKKEFDKKCELLNVKAKMWRIYERKIIRTD